MTTRIRPTDRQLTALALLDDDLLLTTAVECLHSLNRRAKEQRDRRNHYRRATFARAIEDEIQATYSLKDAFLTALVRAGRVAGVYSFTVPGSEMFCSGCGRSWVGSSWCYECQDDTGEILLDDRWYVIDCGNGRRFHQPHVPSDVAALAVPIPPHEPTQPQREIPAVEVAIHGRLSKLTIEAERRCVELATQRLIAITNNGIPCDEADTSAAQATSSMPSSGFTAGTPTSAG